MNPAEVPVASVSELPADGLALLDVREDYEWAGGHAPGAVHIPMGQLPSRLAEVPGQGGEPTLYVICRSGARSAQAAAWLNAQGWDAVNVTGGMQSWFAHGREMAAEHGTPPEVL